MTNCSLQVVAWCSDEPASYSRKCKRQPRKYILAVGHPYRAKRAGEIVSYAEQHFASLLAVTQAGAQIRRGGSAALDLAYVAAGRFDGFFELGLKPWDIAAGELIIKEAGGVVVDARGGNDSLENGQVIACSLKMLKTLMQTVVPAWDKAAK